MILNFLLSFLRELFDWFTFNLSALSEFPTVYIQMILILVVWLQTKLRERWVPVTKMRTTHCHSIKHCQPSTRFVWPTVCWASFALSRQWLPNLPNCFRSYLQTSQILQTTISKCVSFNGIIKHSNFIHKLNHFLHFCCYSISFLCIKKLNIFANMCSFLRWHPEIYLHPLCPTANQNVFSKHFFDSASLYKFQCIAQF